MDEQERLYEVTILDPAQYELEEIARLYLSLSGPKYAKELTDEIYDAFDGLARFPLSGSPVRDEELRALGYRYVVVRDYLAIYRLIGDTVFIYHIVYGKTNYPALFRTKFF